LAFWVGKAAYELKPVVSGGAILGYPVTPREWFLVPLFAIDEAVERIRDGSIKSASYNFQTASFE